MSNGEVTEDTIAAKLPARVTTLRFDSQKWCHGSMSDAEAAVKATAEDQDWVEAKG